MYRTQSTCCSDFHELFCFPHEFLLFQVFQLTTLVFRGPATHGDKFFFSFDCVLIKEGEMRVVLLRVQDFVRGPYFTERNFSLEFGLTMLSESIGIADSITSSPVYAPWSVVGVSMCDPSLH